MKFEKIIFGKNPVLEALRCYPWKVEKIYIRYGSTGRHIDEILMISRKHRIPLSFLDRKKFKSLENKIDTENTQGIVSFLSIVEYFELDDLIARAFEHTNLPILLFLDKIQDPQNFGAIARSAECAGANGLIVTTKDTAPINSTVVKSSSGAILHLPITKVYKPFEAVEKLKQSGFWLVGTYPNAEMNIWNTNFNVPITIVIGNEGKGISRAILKSCDVLVKIPMYGKTDSLNASVSAGVILYEVRRQRDLLVRALPQQ
ncbi:MAG: 23S rRNA (guanosine(2251)-2'-O)-methyltransferase RlmB [Candidatus Kapaibacteriota bacterium]